MIGGIIMDLNEKFAEPTYVLIKGTIKADEDSSAKKNFILKINYGGLTIDQVLRGKAAPHDKINWANSNAGRKQFGKIVDGALIEIRAAHPGAMPIEDPRSAYDKYVDSLPPEARKKELEAQIERLRAVAKK